VRLAWSPRNRSIGFIDAMGLTGTVGFLVARFIPVARLPIWGCPFRQATGWPCPGCGLTRVADRFSHGNLIGAWHANPLGAVGAFLFVVAILLTALHLAFRAPMPRLEVAPVEARWMRVALFTALAVNYAYVIVATRFPQLL
jgi:hypothetical protein